MTLVFVVCLILQIILSAAFTARSCADESLQFLINVEAFKTAIRSGRVYQQNNFLSEADVLHFLNEIDQLENNFERSGLSNTATEKSFGQQDRSVCPVPWWKNMLHDNKEEVLFHPAVQRINKLRTLFAQVLNRPSMMDPLLGHECYYSVSLAGSQLPRHMDERHEELKGPKGWLLPSRRSLSWLIYLSDEAWDVNENGGALRSYPLRREGQQHQQNNCNDSVHQGNLQIGWLLGTKQPVYLNCWFIPEGSKESHNILYTISPEDSSVQHITKPWLTGSYQGMSLAEFILDSQANLFLSGKAHEFALLENRGAWDSGEPPEGSETVDVSPTRGSLVVFDSIMLPHQVEKIKKGRRVALAGWFHEATQEIPDEDFREMMMYLRQN